MAIASPRSVPFSRPAARYTIGMGYLLGCAVLLGVYGMVASVKCSCPSGQQPRRGARAIRQPDGKQADDGGDAHLSAAEELQRRQRLEQQQREQAMLKSKTGTLPAAGRIGAAVARPPPPRRFEAPPRGQPNAFVAVCTAVKDEHCDIREWVLHHASLGVRRFYVFDTGSEPPMRPALQDMIASGLVDYHFVTNASADIKLKPPTEGRSYNWQVPIFGLCLQRYGSRHTWMGFIDADEFVVLTGPDEDSRGGAARRRALAAAAGDDGQAAAGLFERAATQARRGLAGGGSGGAGGETGGGDEEGSGLTAGDEDGGGVAGGSEGAGGESGGGDEEGSGLTAGDEDGGGVAGGGSEGASGETGGGAEEGSGLAAGEEDGGGVAGGSEGAGSESGGGDEEGNGSTASDEEGGGAAGGAEEGSMAGGSEGSSEAGAEEDSAAGGGAYEQAPAEARQKAAGGGAESKDGGSSAAGSGVADNDTADGAAGGGAGVDGGAAADADASADGGAAASAAPGEPVGPLSELLKVYAAHPGLVLHWQLFAWDGHVHRPEGGVLASYTSCWPQSNGIHRHVKSFVQPSRVTGPETAHSFFFQKGMTAVDTTGAAAKGPIVRKGKITYAHAVLHHYISKSLADFEVKAARRGGAGSVKTVAHFLKWERQSTATCTRAVAAGRALAARYNLNRGVPARCLPGGGAPAPVAPGEEA